MARVCLGEVGAIFGLEVSRLARSSADLSKLLELARLTETLVVDADGIYDLADFNDRILLGLKGQMSEAELHILAGRLQGAKRAAAARGELRISLPVGYVYDDEGATVTDPDEEVRAAVADVFAAFTATGSAYGVVGAFADRRFPKRAYGGSWAGELRWGRLTHSRACGVLSNPAYAGAYVFGRFRSRRAVRPDGTVYTRTVELARAEWDTVLGLPADVREAQEIECLRPPKTMLFPVRLREAAELDEPCLVRVQFQVELREPLAKIAEELFWALLTMMWVTQRPSSPAVREAT